MPVISVPVSRNHGQVAIMGRSTGHRRRSSFAIGAEAKSPSETKVLFVASNNFKVKADQYAAFEEMWKKRDTYLKECNGFIRFALLKCDDPGEYRSETFWESRADFVEWTKSKQFQQAHKDAVGAKEEGTADKPAKPTAISMMDAKPIPKFYEAVTVTE